MSILRSIFSSPFGGGGGNPIWVWGILDSFTDADGTSILSHTGESGYGWVSNGTANVTASIINGRVIGTSHNRLKQNYVMPTADYAVRAKIRVLSKIKMKGAGTRRSEDENLILNFHLNLRAARSRYAHSLRHPRKHECANPRRVPRPGAR